MSGNIGVISGPQVLLDVWEALTAEDYGFSENIATRRRPTPIFLSEGQADADETVRLLGTVADGDIEWRDTGRIVGETFSVTIEVDTRVSGTTGPAAVARAIEIACEVQNLFRDPDTGKPKGLGSAPSIIQNYRINSYSVDTFVLEDKGYGCVYEMVLRVNTRH